MQTFTKTRIALAVSAALTVGGISAAYAAAPIILASATKNTLAVAQSGFTLTNLYKATGEAGNGAKSIDIGVLLDTAAAGLLDAGLAWNNGTTTPAANDDLLVTFTPAGGVVTLIPKVQLTLAYTNAINAGVVGAASATTANTVAITTIAANAGDTYRLNLRLVPAAGTAIRINNTNGQLEYSADAGVTFGPVSMQVLKAGANALSDAGATAIAASLTAATPVTAGPAVFALTPTSKTFSAAGAALINGLTVDFGNPVTAPTTTELDILSRVPTPAIGVSKVLTAGSITAAAGTTVTITATTGSTTAFDVKVGDMTKVDWDASDAAGGPKDIAAAASIPDFNTGVTGAGVPMELGFKTGKAIAYTNIFNPATGTATANTIGIAGTGTVTFAATGTTSTDGAAPVLVKAESTVAGTTGTTALRLTFSEPIVFENTATPGVGDDVREIAENVKIGTNSLAALNLNAGGALSASIGLSSAQGQLTINGVQGADANAASATVTVGAGISVYENSDTGFSATAARLETGGAGFGGVKSTSTVVQTGDVTAGEALSAAATAISAAQVSVTFTTGTVVTASAITSASDSSKVDSVQVKFASGSEVQYGTGKTATDLARDLVVTVNGLSGQVPVLWQFHPAAADISPDVTSPAGGGTTFSIKLPTALIFAKIDPGTLTKIDITYNGTTFGGSADPALVVSAGTKPNVQDGTVVASLPISVTATTSTLLTQSIVGTLTGQNNGSVIRAWLCKWGESQSKQLDVTVSVLSGKVSRAGDSVLQNVSISFQDIANLQTKIHDELVRPLGTGAGASAGVSAIGGVRDAAAQTPPRPITVYAVMDRSNDTRANNNGNFNASANKGNGDSFQASVTLSTTDAGARSVQSGAGIDNPVYVLSLDPVTGNLTGTLTGSIATKVTKVNQVPGLQPVFVGQSAGTCQDVAEGQVDGTGKFNLLAGLDPTSNAVIAGGLTAAATFLILVHEDPARVSAGAGTANATRFTQLTSANPAQATFLPFTPNLLSLSGARTVLGVNPGIAAPFTATTGSAATIDLAKYKVGNFNNAVSNWWIRSSVNPANAAGAPAGASFARAMVAIDLTGAPISTWTGEPGGSGSRADMAMVMTNSKTFFATELVDANGFTSNTLSTITPASFTNGAAAFAFLSDGQPAQVTTHSVAQGAAVTTVKVGPGWSLVTVPSSGNISSGIDAIIRVGAQLGTRSQFTWLKADGASALPTLTPDEGVFVFCKPTGTSTTCSL